MRHTPQMTLTPRQTPGASVTGSEGNGWRLEIPAGPGNAYRLAQLDDYQALPRKRFLWRAGTRLTLDARASHTGIPGTWGFGLWNDPFSFSVGVQGAARRLPAPPNAVWFFVASAPNYLSLRDDQPAQGSLAMVFCSRPLPPLLLAGAGFGLPLLAIPPLARRLRAAGRRFVRQESAAIPFDPTGWLHYELDWRVDGCRLCVEGLTVLNTPLSPRGPLGLVLWIDNQYAAFTPEGKLSFGVLPCEEENWIEIKNFQCLTSA